jgi:hypothetical protein
MKKILFIAGVIALFLSAYAIAQAIPPNAGEVYVMVNEWGSFGSGEGKFWNPTGIAVDSTGNVYVADRDNHRIQKFTTDGEFITDWNIWYGPLANLEEMRFPSGVAVDTSGNVYVTDRDNYRVVKFTSDGTFLTTWGTEVVPREGVIDPLTGEIIFPGGCDCKNRKDEQFLFPEEIAVDLSGNVYVIDNCAIQKFTSGGQFLETWEVGDCSQEGEGDTKGNAIRFGIAPDSNGNIYLIGHLPKNDPEIAPLYELYNLIYQYTSNHQFITKWGAEEEGNPPTSPVGEFLDWSGIALDSSNNVYAVDRNYAGATQIRIQKFTPLGEFLTQWTTDRQDIDETEVTSTGIAINKTGGVYLINGNTIQKFFIKVATTTTTTGGGPTTTTTTVLPVGNPPQAQFTVTPSSGSISTVFAVDASGSTDAEDSSAELVVRWDWENDGVWDTQYSATKTATHQYAGAGAQTIRLEVKDTDGNTSTAQKVVNVGNQNRICPAAFLLGKESPRLGALRKFRDNVLAGSQVGNKMIELYYKNGARIIGIMEKMPVLKKSAKVFLETIIP